MNTAELRARAKELDYKTLGHFDYRTRLAALETQWREWLTEEYLSDPVVTQVVAAEVWNRAWEEGHSEGYERVEQCFSDLADFVDIVLRECSA